MPTAVRPERESVPAVPMGSTSPRSISVEDLPTLVVDSSALEIASRVLAIINRYRLQGSRNDSAKADEGASKFLAVIHSHVRAGNAVPMCLPAFPFKSPNNSAKVLGKLPDRAEELALAHLNGLCQAIQDIYPPGAKLTIISDGLVYNGTSSMRSKLCHPLSKRRHLDRGPFSDQSCVDLLGVPDKDVWNYGQGLRRLAHAKGFSRIEFSRLRDLVSLSLSVELDEMTYVANASNFRRALLNTFGNPNWEWEEVSRIKDVCLTYRGYMKFLQTDLADVYPVGDGRTKSRYKRGIEYIAKQMMVRGDVSLSRSLVGSG